MLRRHLPCQLIGLLLAAASLGVHAAPAAERADFGPERPTAVARQVADWAVRTRNHAGLPFVIIDKVSSRVYVFDGTGRLRGTSAALLGLARGDDSVPGIGQRGMSTIRPEERTTPAGRFVASIDLAPNGDEILWVDYDAAIALHRVIATRPKERRLQRLASQTAADRRITYGCINVPVAFFEKVVLPAFRGTQGIVYVLPETREASAVFGSMELPIGPAGQ